MERLFLLALIAALTACAPAAPDLEDRISAQAQAQGYPSLLPLDTLLSSAEGALPRNAEAEGRSLEARVEDLRRRAAWLRAQQL